MDKTEINMNGNLNKRQLQGLRNAGMCELKCIGCEKKLLQIQKATSDSVGSQNVITRVVAKCGYCGQYSQVEQIVGQFYPGAPDDFMFFEIIEQEDGAPDSDVVFSVRSK